MFTQEPTRKGCQGMFSNKRNILENPCDTQSPTYII